MLEYDEGPREGFTWQDGPEDFVNVKGVTITQVDNRPDAGVKWDHVWTPWEIIQYTRGSGMYTMKINLAGSFQRR